MNKEKELVMIHGWDPNFYTNNLQENHQYKGVAWINRKELISKLRSQFDVKFFDLAGFSGKAEPKSKFYDIENFSDDLNTWLLNENIEPLALIGYSFGGAVALNYKLRYKARTPVVLISPALTRKESTFSAIGNVSKDFVPGVVKEQLKSVYQYIFSKYYRHGSPFIRQSYDNIVRRNTSNDLEKVNCKDILLIYGTKDSSTPWIEVKDIVIKMGINHILINGGHNIGETNAVDIFNAITDFVK